MEEVYEHGGIKTPSIWDVIAEALREHGRRISELEERVKEMHEPRQVYSPRQSFWSRLVDPICIVCGAKYWSYSHEHGLCPRCAQKYPWLR